LIALPKPTRAARAQSQQRDVQARPAKCAIQHLPIIVAERYDHGLGGALRASALSGLGGALRAPLGPVVAPLVPRCALLPAPPPRLMGLRPMQTCTSRNRFVPARI